MSPARLGDPVTAEVIAGNLLTTAEEMGVTLVRTAFSPNIKERADCSTAVFDRSGQVIAQAHRIPIHLGSMLGAVREILKRVPHDEMREGDMYAANDPYNGGGSHLPDINVVAPVHIEGQVVAYVANIAHHADVGGMVPGSESAVCKTIYQEGLRLPPVRLAKEGKLNRDVADIILLNSRTPDERLGDLQAQMAANFVGIRSISALFERYGYATVDAAQTAYLDFTERRFMQAIGKLPNGTYSAEDSVESAGDEAPVAVQLALTVDDEKLHFDFTGSARQLDNSLNIPKSALLATVYTVAKSLLDPGVPANAGYFRTIQTTAPEGSIVNPTPPAAVGSRALSSAIVGDVIAAAITEASSDYGLARSGPHHQILLSGVDERKGSFFVDYETFAGGMGARSNSDGMDAVRVHASGASNLPIEALEHSYPLRVVNYRIREGSGGPGRYRGGNGISREYLIENKGVTVSLSSQRQQVGARGAEKGHSGATGQFTLNPGTTNEVRLPSAVADYPLPPGSILRIETPGGGGYGCSDNE